MPKTFLKKRGTKDVWRVVLGNKGGCKLMIEEKKKNYNNVVAARAGGGDGICCVIVIIKAVDKLKLLQEVIGSSSSNMRLAASWSRVKL